MGYFSLRVQTLLPTKYVTGTLCVLCVEKLLLKKHAPVNLSGKRRNNIITRNNMMSPIRHFNQNSMCLFINQF